MGTREKIDDLKPSDYFFMESVLPPELLDGWDTEVASDTC